jgi:hypothetical protein
MARRVSVTAVEAFTYEGRPVAIGERVAMWPLDAAAAGQRGQVSLTRPVRAQAPEPPPEPEKRRRTYRRRDLQPEP